MTPPASGPIPGFHAVIPAGGAGTRLWPLSRSGAPKFLHDLTGSGRSLLQATVDRLAPLTEPGAVLVVTGARHDEAVRGQLPDLEDGAVLAERHGDVVLGSFAADQVIHGSRAFGTAVREGVEAARAGYVVTVGIAASHPSTAFGYVRSGERLGLAGAPTALHAVGFTEKPDVATATAYLATGEYRWNAGMFLVRAAVLLDHLAEQRPALHDGLRTLARAWDTPDRETVLAEVWPALEKIAIDHAIAEPVAAAGGVAVVPGDFGWDDVGDFASLATLLPPVAGAEDDGARVLGDDASVVRLDSLGSVVVAGSHRLVAVLGIDDVVVVDTPDALLVTTRARAQQVKSIVDAVRARGATELL
jgi:mannose-1-phosphate guanylyltransferase